MAAGIRSPAIHAVANATRRAIAGESQRAALPSAALKTPAGTWLVLHGGVLGSPRSGGVVVFIQRAHPTLVAPLLLKAFGLSPREQDVVQLTLRGASAARPLSAWTSPRTLSTTT
jgi:hypothetical protein